MQQMWKPSDSYDYVGQCSFVRHEVRKLFLSSSDVLSSRTPILPSRQEPIRTSSTPMADPTDVHASQLLGEHLTKYGVFSRNHKAVSGFRMTLSMHAHHIVHVEVDEVTIRSYASGLKDKPVNRISYIGIVEKGRPSSLRLIQMPVRSTVMRAPGPGPITKELWLPIARKVFLTGHRVCLHTDSARAYNVPVPEVSHTSVVHQVKKVDGVWVRPIFAKRTTIEIAQTIDASGLILETTSRATRPTTQSQWMACGGWHSSCTEPAGQPVSKLPSTLTLAIVL
eukprot:4865295-Amphidinium_carterae.6